MNNYEISFNFWDRLSLDNKFVVADILLIESTFGCIQKEMFRISLDIYGNGN